MFLRKAVRSAIPKTNVIGRQIAGFRTSAFVLADKHATTTTESVTSTKPAAEQISEYAEYDFPKTEEQTIGTSFVQSTGLEREERAIGFNARFPEEFNVYRTEREWGTFEKPVIVPTTQPERIVECTGLCVEEVPVGESRMWVMRPGEWCLCDECGQVFACVQEQDFFGEYTHGDENADEHDEHH